MENKVTVIIPAHNEEVNIKEVIEIMKKDKDVEEIIVVDNCSTDKTEEISIKLGAKVIKCHQKGKGYAMEIGLQHAENEIIVFLDADINYNSNIVRQLIKPLQNKQADFVKSTFERIEGGKVTEIAIKPLLDILFPQMYKFSEPLSGMIAGKKSLLEKIQLEKDYGVDIGILLDMIELNAEIEEVNIGKIKNMSHITKTTDKMGNMSTEVMRAILKRVKHTKKYEMMDCC